MYQKLESFHDRTATRRIAKPQIKYDRMTERKRHGATHQWKKRSRKQKCDNYTNIYTKYIIPYTEKLEMYINHKRIT